MQLTFHGGKELVQALRQLPRAVRQRVLVGAMLAGGGIIQKDASTRAPRDASPRRRAGAKRLADSIRTVVAEELPSAVSVNVITRDPKAHLVEFGHRNVPRGPNRRRVSVTRVSKSGRVTSRLEIDPYEKRVRRDASGFTPPKPFMRPAFENNKEAVLRKIGAVLGVGIEAEAKRLASGRGAS